MSRNLFHRLARSASRVFGGRRPSPRRPRSWPPQVEALETRQLLACNPGIVNRRLLANCDNTPNNVELVTYPNDDVLINWAPAGSRSFRYGDFDSILINLGSANDTFFTASTPPDKPLTVDAGAGLNTVTLLANSNSLYHNLRGPVTIENPQGLGSTAIVLRDLFGRGAVSHDTFTSQEVSYGRVSGLVRFPILYRYAGASSLDFHSSRYFLATVNVQATGAPLRLVAHAPYATVNVGYNGSVQGILGQVTVDYPSDGDPFAFLNVDDSADTLFRRVTHDTPNISLIQGLAPAPIRYSFVVLSVMVRTGRGGADVEVRRTNGPLTLVGNSDNTTVRVGQNGSLGAIGGHLTVENAGGATALEVNASADAANSTMNLRRSSATHGEISGLSSHPISYKYSETASLSLTTGAGVNTFELRDDGGVATAIFSGGGNDVFRMTGPDTVSNLFLDGGAGRNLLDFFAYQTGVFVLMPSRVATGVRAFGNIQDAVGGQGDNLLVGDDQDNLLYGNNGRDVLIGGGGADSLSPGPGEDLVIGGYTDFDYDIDALLTISSVWSLPDSDYATRIDLLTGGYEGIPVLSAATVHDDYAGNQLAGNSGLDWFFAGVADVLEDLEEGERVDSVF